MIAEQRQAHPASFRDPSGFVYEEGGRFYRQVNRSYRHHFELFVESGLAQRLFDQKLLHPFDRVDESEGDGEAFALLESAPIPFISYPYEWSFGQLRAAALATLEIERVALQYGMSLKDASAYNVQFVGAHPLFIDTLSFEAYVEGAPWVAYRQFCQHFLAPLALMAYVDVRLGTLLRSYIDGVPLDLASRLLPSTTKLKPGLLAHLHLHSKASAADQKVEVEPKSAYISLTARRALVDSLKGAIEGLHWDPKGTEWGDYYATTNYSADAMLSKRELVTKLLEEIPGPRGQAWDLGANSGEFSSLAAEQGWYTVACDIDPAAVEHAFRSGRPQIQPLLLDLTNPSPNQGWANTERSAFTNRGPCQLVLALALVHHLAIGNNVPLGKVAGFLAECGSWVVAEFVPKEDSQVQRLLRSREDIFPEYTQGGWEDAVSARFEVMAVKPIPGTLRTLYLLRTKA